MLYFRIFLLALIACIASFTAAQTTGRFIEPAELGTESSDPRTFKVYKVGDILDVSWTTSASEGAVFDLVINQLRSPLTQIDRTPNSGKSLSTDFLSKTSYRWKIATDGSDGGSKFDLTFSNQFNFILFRRDETASLANTVYFNITNSTVNRLGNLISTTSTSSTATFLPTTSSDSITISRSATEIPTTSSTGASQTTDTPPTSKGLSPQATIGLGVGIGLGVAALIAAFAVWFCVVRPKRRNTQEPVMEQNHHGNLSYQVDPADAHHNWSPPAELQGAARERENGVENGRRSELSGRESQQGKVFMGELPG